MIEQTAAAATQAGYLAVIPLAPLLGAVVLALRGERLQKRLGKGFVGNVAVATVGGSFLLSLGAFFRLVGMDPEARAGEREKRDQRHPHRRDRLRGRDRAVLAHPRSRSVASTSIVSNV